MKNLFIFLLLVGVLHAQVGINILPNNHNLLEISSSEKGVLLTKSSGNYTSFPNFSTSQFDLFNDDETLEGALLFNVDDKQYYLYDGRSWNPAKQVTAVQNPFASRIRNTGSTSILCLQFAIANLCLGAGEIPTGTQAENKNELIIDNLNIHNSDITIVDSGLYVIVASIGFSGGVLQCGFGSVQYQSNIEIQYPGNNNWITISTMNNYSGSFIIDFGGDKNSSASLSVYLPTGAKVRAKPSIKSPALTCGGLGAYSSSENHIQTYLGVQLIHKY